MNENLSALQVFTMLLAEKFRPRYDTRLQLLTYQVKMLRSRIDDSKIYTTQAERAEMIRLGERIEHDISDVMLVVKPATYRRWLKPKEAKRRRTGRTRTPQATVNLVLQFATENLTWGYANLTLSKSPVESISIQASSEPALLFRIRLFDGSHPLEQVAFRFLLFSEGYENIYAPLTCWCAYEFGEWSV